MKILIVEDNQTDRDLLKYLLSERFQKEAKFREADSLRTALAYLSKGDIDCIILDLQLPDSSGKETFQKINDRYPSVPIVVMTNTKDRDVAITMIRNGAADYIIKDFTNEEEIFRRIVFSVEKHRNSIRVPPMDATTVHRLERAQANLKVAHASGEHIAINTSTAETTAIVADLSRLMFTELQKINVSLATRGLVIDQVKEVVEEHDRVLLKGYPNQLSLKSQMETNQNRLALIESTLEADRTTKIEIHRTASLNRTKLLIAVIGLLGVLATAYFTNFFPKTKTSTTQQ